jgi:hypothetical protein
MRIFVINAYDDRMEKYNSKYELFQAVWWEDVTEEETKKYYFRHNAKMELRKKIVACSQSHKKLLLKIIQENLEDVIIMEDDAILDFSRLDELKGLKNFTYIGGEITSKLMKDMKKFRDEEKADVIHSLCKGVNKIEPEYFKIGQTCGYFIPNAEVAQKIHSNLPNGEKERGIDTEYIYQQRRGIITDFIFPPLVKLYVPDAKKGFTYSNYTLASDQSEY